MTGAHQHGESDWEDLDLLTVGLARERLDEEIAALQGRLEADPAPDDPELTSAYARLAALIATRQRMSGPPAR